MKRAIVAAFITPIIILIMIIQLAWHCFVAGTNWIDRKMDDVFSKWM